MLLLAPDLESDLRLQKVLFTHASEKTKRKKQHREKRRRKKRHKEKRREEEERDESRRIGLRQEPEEHFGNPITHFAQYMACSSVPLASENHFDI